MTQQYDPRETDEPLPAEKPRRSYRVSAADTERSRRRGLRRGNASRWALRGLPPIEEDEP